MLASSEQLVQDFANQQAAAATARDQQDEAESE